MAEKSVKKLFLLDGMALAYRAHFAFAAKPIMTSGGMNTSAVYGFTNTLVELLKNQNPTHWAVVFDTEAPTQRHATFADYKAQREAMPEDLSRALPYIKRMAQALTVPVIAMDGYEADDVIGTLARKAESEGADVFIVTSDKDFGQLVSEKVRIYKPARMGDGVEILGPREVLEKWGIQRVEQVIDILGLWGDASDNIPGVPGIGEKTAQKLVSQYGTVENILQHTHELKGKLKESLEANRELALLSKKLATIQLDVPVSFSVGDLERRDMDRAAVAALCTELEFNTLGRRLLGEDFKAGRGQTSVVVSQKKPAAAHADDLFAQDHKGCETATSPVPATHFKTIRDVEHRYHTLKTVPEIQALTEKMRAAKTFCFDVETTGLDPKSCALLGVAVCLEPHTAYFLPTPETENEKTRWFECLKPVFEDEQIEKTGHNLKFDINVLRWQGIEVGGRLFDTMLAHALIEPDQRHGMDYLAEVYLGYSPIPLSRLIGEKKGGQIEMRMIPAEQLAEYAAEDADVTLQLRLALEPLLKEKRQEKVFYEIESPLLPVLADMESLGVAIDRDILRHISVELEKSAAALEKSIFNLAGVTFNLNSPKQLGDVLFHKLQIKPAPKKTKTGQFATDEQTLLGLAPHNEIIRRLLEFREITKLKSTYVDALPACIHPRIGRVHTTYNQLATSTGRLNSQDPNLQNIPIRTAQGREVRKAFVVTEPDKIFLTADYSQIELRIIAALSQDPNLLGAFASGEDIHQSTAAKVFGVAASSVTPEMRRRAKMVNFGIIYGISAFGLAQRLGIGRGEAGEIIESYFRQYPNVKQYLTQTIEFARQYGYVETVTGRRRYLRDITSANATARAAAERNAINMPIQGTAADMIKLAMIHIHASLREQGLKTRMILQVHDELVFEMARAEEEVVRKLVEEKMKRALPELKAPIEVVMATGSNWLEAHG
jgi:DNA polymerase-1